MGEQDAFERIVASMHEAMLDDSRWPATSALIDEACGLTGNDLIVREGPLDDVRVLFVGAYCRGQRREDQERGLPRELLPPPTSASRASGGCPTVHLVHVRDLLTAEELKTSPTYNEMLLRTGGQDSLNARLDGPDGSSITWGLRDPVDASGWGASRGYDGHEAAAPHPAVRPCPAGARTGRGAAHDRDRPARQPADRRPPPGPARADARRQRPRPRHPAARRRVDGPERDAGRPRAGRPGPARADGGRRPAGRRTDHGQRVDAAPPLGRAAAVRRARQARAHPAARLRRAPRPPRWC